MIHEIYDLYSVLNIVKLANTLHPQSYMQHSLSTAERLVMISGRKIARAVLCHVLSHYQTGPSDPDLQNVYWEYLVYQARAIICATHYAEGGGVLGFENIKVAAKVECFIQMTFVGMLDFEKRWLSLVKQCPDMLLLPSTPDYDVVPCNAECLGMQSWSRLKRTS